MSRVRAPRDEWSRINALETRIAALERSNALALAAIPNPASGTSDYVLATQLAYGLSGQTIVTTENGATGTWYDLATPGPSVTVTIGTSGRALVLGVANVQPSNAAGPGYIGISVDGATPGTDLTASTGGAIKADNTPAGAMLVVAEVLTGLTPGSHAFKMRYEQGGAAGTNGTAYSDRTLVVWPF